MRVELLAGLVVAVGGHLGDEHFRTFLEEVGAFRVVQLGLRVVEGLCHWALSETGTFVGAGPVGCLGPFRCL